MAGSLLDTVIRVATAVSLAAMLTIALATVIGSSHPVPVSVRLWLSAGVAVAVARATLQCIRRWALRSDAFATAALIVGAGEVGQHLAMRLIGDPRYGLRPVGFLDADPLEVGKREDSLVPVLGDPDELADCLRRTGARHVIFAFASEPDRLLVEKVRQCEQLGVTVSLVPRLFESINDRATLDYVGGLPLVSVRPTNPRGWQFALKHAFDRSFAFLALAAAAPLMITIAIAVRLSSPGPILFRQRRVGRDGHEFDVLKFRTMRVSSGDRSEFLLPEGVAPGGIEGQDRRTPIGRFLRDSSLDELPQLINVLRGDMSIVGPRPERPAYVKRFRRDVDRYDDRHRVRSGITGWAQVNGLRGRTSIADRVEWDNYYIRNWSLALDLRIIVLTVAEVFRLRGG
ncbi:MAG: exopolysaccharide biosynthesis polyprenyl glycosylphosphotransferase [Solirubrobacterales bacterium]|nr:exopolysaccharide biosynthesis polyprenyl glycosylphosphotransferase [Solirubrobacterales bacterium]